MHYNALPERVKREIESRAFRSLVRHLRDRSSSVSNLEMMTKTGQLKKRWVRAMGEGREGGEKEREGCGGRRLG